MPLKKNIKENIAGRQELDQAKESNIGCETHHRNRPMSDQQIICTLF